MKHVVQFSGGIGSFAAAVRVAERYGTDDLVLLIADAGFEDEDLWRFAEDTGRLLGVPLTRVADGRNPLEVFADKRFLGNNRLAPCSLELKIKPCRRWLEANANPADTVLYIGIDSSARDRRRIRAIARGWRPWRTSYPLCSRWEAARTKDELLQEARDLGVDPPRLYGLGFEHNNCAGRCVRAGKRQWLHTLEVFPERYAEVEAFEESFRARHGDYAILKEQRNKVVRPLTLRELRLRAEAERSERAVAS
ncbi:hypothetical protein [Streptomyces sp. NRRL S-495]|uniref:hypothetical protein n=1 Tax=Streptomyces sp. NRRL S-495 TaxID=1609133 RepID=UPI0005F94209|nr:hypothetical protein [Streptomyces sp. NRRL S-495]KJY32152.1 hypothetical protein VR45_23330 [Streptomyces sp. NRRL S-495]